jgi:cell division protein FtsB
MADLDIASAHQRGPRSLASQVAAMQADLESLSRRERKAVARIARLEDEKSALVVQVIALQKENLSLLDMAASHPRLVCELEEAKQIIAVVSRKLERRTVRFREETDRYRSTIDKLEAVISERKIESFPEKMSMQRQIANLQPSLNELRALTQQQRARIESLEEQLSQTLQPSETTTSSIVKNHQLRSEFRKSRPVNNTGRKSDIKSHDTVKQENQALVIQAADIEQELSDSRAETHEFIARLERPEKLETMIAELKNEQHELVQSLSGLRKGGHTSLPPDESGDIISSPSPRKRPIDELIRENETLRSEIEHQRKANDELRRWSTSISSRNEQSHFHDAKKWVSSTFMYQIKIVVKQVHKPKNPVVLLIK